MTSTSELKDSDINSDKSVVAAKPEACLIFSKSTKVVANKNYLATTELRLTAECNLDYN